MNTEVTTIEDLLEVLAGLTSTLKINIDPTDATIMYSIARQSFKGTALTDRQFSLMKEKLQVYKEQFVAGDINFDLAVETLRQPLRQIDRSKYITTQDEWIKVRFPFSKKLIVDLQSIKCHHCEHKHQKGSHEHYFLFNESNVYNVVDMFKNKTFNIDKELLDLYDQLSNLSYTDHVPCVDNMQLKNLHPNGVKLIEDEIGPISKDNLLLYKDRQLRYGYEFKDSVNTGSILSQKIAHRNKATVFIESTEYPLQDVIASLHELERFPVVIMLTDDAAYDTLVTTYNLFKNFIPNNEISVLMRLDSNISNGFNEYIKEHKLNSPVDKNTKVVYINKNKINKPLMQSDCSPKTILMTESAQLHSKQQYYSNEFDLVVHYDENISQFMRVGHSGIGIQRL